MSKEEWGVKRICLSCSARFYDFNKSPIVCPSCGAIFDPEYLLKKKNKSSHERDEDVEGIEIDVNDDTLIDDDSTEDIDDLDETEDDIALDGQKN